MEHFDLFIFIIEIISITSFAISGAVTAIKKKLDMFGVVIIGVTTSIGGGIIRDLILGITPPKTFMNPSYTIVAAVTAVITFLIEFRHAKKVGGEMKSNRFTEAVLFWLDSAGLGIFTMVGIATAYEISSEFSGYLLCFVGVITGVGGGILRDILTGQRPYIFVKHFYASTCIIGSIVCISLWEYTGRIIAMLIGAAVVVILRFFAAKYRWGLPAVPQSEG